MSMATYPRTPRTAFLEWCRTHEDVFIDHAAEIGISAASGDVHDGSCMPQKPRRTRSPVEREALTTSA
jgi:hypothetical protein